MNFHVRCICRGKITATEDTAQCGDRSVVHTLTWCSAQPKLLQGLERRRSALSISRIGGAQFVLLTTAAA